MFTFTDNRFFHSVERLHHPVHVADVNAMIIQGERAPLASK
jgi:hypothetical protein